MRTGTRRRMQASIVRNARMRISRRAWETRLNPNLSPDMVFCSGVRKMV